MRFFNFWNVETYHFTQWVIHAPEVDLDAMIKKAFPASAQAILIHAKKWAPDLDIPEIQ